jgi:hypothetical protein
MIDAYRFGDPRPTSSVHCDVSGSLSITTRTISQPIRSFVSSFEMRKKSMTVLLSTSISNRVPSDGAGG